MKEDIAKESDQTIVEKELMYRQIVEYSVETIIIHADYKILYVNQSGAINLKGSKEEIIGSCLLDRYREASKPAIKERIHKSMTGNVPGELMEEKIFRLDDKLIDVELYCHPVVFGNKRAIQTALRDITKRKEKEKQHKREINEVSTPLVPVFDGISVLPIIGSVDIDRANHLLEVIPSKIKKEEVRCLVIDFSGIYNFCEVVSDFLMKITAIMKLLGIHTIITGIRPELARMAVERGVDLSSTNTMATVQEAVKYHLG
jgi:rsbT co-antagonist protein RsbR